jgi:hypothetical protein
MKLNLRHAIPALAIVLAVPLVAATAGARSARPTGALPSEVVGFGNQATAQPTFGVFASGSGNTATGLMHFAVSVPQPHYLDATVNCLIISGNDAIITGHIVGHPKQVVVAEVVDNTSPSDPSNPDLLRFSFKGFIHKSGPTGCWAPEISPPAIDEGDLLIR